MKYRKPYKIKNSNYKVSEMNSYILAISIVVFGILVHYGFIASYKEGLTSKEAAEQAAEKAAAAAAEQKKEDNAMTTWWKNQAQSLLNNAKKQQETIKTLDANNKQYQQILACLQYRKDLMNVEIARNRAGRNAQGANKKAKTKALFNTASNLG